MPRRILTADDSAANSQMLINALHKDYDIIEAENRKETLGLLLDFTLPGMDGFSVLKKCCKAPKYDPSVSGSAQTMAKKQACGRSKCQLRRLRPGRQVLYGEIL